MEDKSAYTISVTKPKRTISLGDLSIDGKAIKTTDLKEIQSDEVEHEQIRPVQDRIPQKRRQLFLN